MFQSRLITIERGVTIQRERTQTDQPTERGREGKQERPPSPRVTQRGAREGAKYDQKRAL